MARKNRASGETAVEDGGRPAGRRTPSTGAVRGDAARGRDSRPAPAGRRAHRGLRALAATATITLFLVVVAGALVSATGSGEGCGRSWPLCGSPVWTVAAVIEFSHRIVSGVAALAVVALAAVAPRRLGGRRDARWLAVVAIAFLFLQAGLGAGVVLWGQPDAVLALHFGISLVSFASVALLSLRVWYATGTPVPVDADPAQRTGAGSRDADGNGTAAAPVAGRAASPGLPGSGPTAPAFPAPWRRAIWFLLAYTYVVVYTGAYVRHTNTSLACPSWPACGGPWEGPAAIQMVHRLAAGVLLVALVVMAVLARRGATGRDRSAPLRVPATGTGPGDPAGSLPPGWVRGLSLAAGLAVLQALSGGYVVLSRLDLAATMLHSSLITLMFAVLCHLGLEALGPRWSLASYGAPGLALGSPGPGLGGGGHGGRILPPEPAGRGSAPAPAGGTSPAGAGPFMAGVGGSPGGRRGALS
ncbi:cytochrome oxidase assembly [Thermaerobacter marianensis DSM 12885]|uniref:Cytochrome oxidase assembly n=1 Tax=Thermaerobacter marianensis (strain ATCC 700841 / DSM 12885 / JCM 10246 / 7p75a) TaxID=644966 RepID=E6SGA6_THEM7|nr:COX15/CtaA family protein [Thermaerobacter marianensis]ADU50523.1 cytochrome oxidase assembly [Thermaerobacter marianensis DSM 12885]